MSFEKARFNMIEQQVRPWNVLRADVLESLAQIPREAFTPTHLKALAFSDTEIPLPSALACMMSPKVEARLVHDLDLTGLENVLEIGTGSGYSAALLSRHAAQVVTVEINGGLADEARQKLIEHDCDNVTVIHGDGALPATAANYGPFDAIVLSGSVGLLPEALLSLLKPEGRLLTICGNEPIMHATLVRKVGDQIRTQVLWDANAPRLQNFPELEAFVF
jgi:protein-L-isoaspartate(D-aspartate) O-methyltransferase